MSSYYDLTFATNKGKTRKLRINNAKLMSDTLVKNSLTSMISADVFEQTNGRMSSVKTANYVSVIREPVF